MTCRRAQDCTTSFSWKKKSNWHIIEKVRRQEKRKGIDRTFEVKEKEREKGEFVCHLFETPLIERAILPKGREERGILHRNDKEASDLARHELSGLAQPHS